MVAEVVVAFLIVMTGRFRVARAEQWHLRQRVKPNAKDKTPTPPIVINHDASIKIYYDHEQGRIYRGLQGKQDCGPL